MQFRLAEKQDLIEIVKMYKKEVVKNRYKWTSNLG